MMCGNNLQKFHVLTSCTMYNLLKIIQDVYEFTITCNVQVFYNF